MTEILVTGATGNVSQQVVSSLLEQGASVRAGVRDPDRATRLAEAGAEVVRYDHDDPPTLTAAFDGVERAFLLVPFVPDFAELGRAAVEAARQAGVKHVVKLSAIGADAASDFWIARNHGLVDEALAASGIGYTILRPTFFMDNFINYAGATIRAQGTFYGAGGEQQVSWVSSRDIAAVAAEALLHPEKHAGQTYELTGGEASSGAEVARVLSSALGREITYTDLSLDQYAEGARQRGTPELFVEAFVGLEKVKAQGHAAAISPHVEQVLGRKPERLADFIQRNADRLK